MKSASLKIAIIALAVIAGGLGTWWFTNATRERNAVIALLPPVPDLTHAHPDLRQGIEAADLRATQRGTAVAGLAELASMYHANGYLDTAMFSYEGLARLEPDEGRWPHRHASILAGFGQAEPALKLWERTLAIAPDYLPARLRHADLLLKDSQTDAARAAYENILAENRDNAWALLGLARIDLEAENWADARRRLERVVDLSNYHLGYDLIVTLYERLGLDRNAEAIRGRASASGAYRDPTDPWLDALMEDCFDSFRLALEAGAKARHGDTETALRWLTRALEVSPDDVSAHYQMAGLQQQLRNTQAAMEHYRRCTQLDPQFSDGWAQLSGMLDQLGDRPQADKVLAEGLEYCPDSPGLHRMNARRLLERGQVGAAIVEFRTAIRLRPNEPDPYIELGSALIGMNRRAEGIAQIEAALVYDPLNPSSLGILAFDAIESGDQIRADQWMQRIESQPRFERTQIDQLNAAYRKAFGTR